MASTNDVLITKPAELASVVTEVVQSKRVVDVHGHDMPDCTGPFAQVGPDKSLIFHYCESELRSGLRHRTPDLAEYNALPEPQRADRVAAYLYSRPPLSAHAQGMLHSASRLGVDVCHRDPNRVMREWRTLFNDLGPQVYTDRIFELAGVSHFVSTQSVFQPAEAKLYLDDKVMATWDERYLCGLRADELVHRPELAQQALEHLPFDSASILELSAKRNIASARTALMYWCKRLPNVEYIALSLSGDTDFMSRKSRPLVVLEQVMLPVAKELGLPMFLMPFVKRGLNPGFANGGDCVEDGDISGLISWIGERTDVNFIITVLHPGNQHNVHFATRALPNLRVVGHWWGNMVPVLIEQQLRERFELLGYVHHGFNSDARVRDHMVYKWDSYREILAKVLTDVLGRILGIRPLSRADVVKTVDGVFDHNDLFLGGIRT